MSTTDDRSHIVNEWTCDKKLSEVDVRSNEWHETYQNVHFSSIWQFVGLAIGRWFILFYFIYLFIFFFFFAHGARVEDKNVFRSEAERNFFISLLMGRSGNRKPDYFLGHRIALPCCGYSLESHWRCVFKEYPERVLWRNKQNYPLNITRYPP